MFLITPIFLLLAGTNCPAAPAEPEHIEGWAVQVTDTIWRTEVPGWISAPAPVCWTLGRVPLEFPKHSTPLLPSFAEPGPWIAGVDYVYGQPCPAEANGNCFIPSLTATRECPDGAKNCGQPPALPPVKTTP